MSWSSHNRGAGSCLLSIGTVIAAVGPFYATECMAQPEFGVEGDAITFASDNPFLLPGDGRASGAIDVAARPYVDWDLDPRTRLEVTSELGFRQYFQHYGNFFTGFGDVELRHRHNEFLTVAAHANYSRDLIADILTDSIDLAFDRGRVRESGDARATVTWNPNANLTITGDGGWQHYRYPGSLLLQTTDAFDVGASASKRISTRTSVGVDGRFTSSHPVDSEDTSVATLGLTAEHRFSEKWRGNVRLGVEWPHTNAILGRDADDRTRLNGDIRLCYEPQFTTACLTGSIGSEVSGLGGLQREFTVGGTVRSRISERGTITAEAAMRKAETPGPEIAARVMRAGAGYEHRLNRRLFLITGASYLERRIEGAKVGAFIIQFGISIRGERL